LHFVFGLGQAKVKGFFFFLFFKKNFVMLLTKPFLFVPLQDTLYGIKKLPAERKIQK
jgi:hypothetical protein